MRRGYDDERRESRGHDRRRAGHGHHDRPYGGRERGIPDSLLVGLLAFLLGLTLLVWTATGLAGLFAHGAWPDGVDYPGTPMALRHLVSAPHDMAAAWPGTPRSQLPGYGLFWGILIGEVMVLLVLALFALGTITRYRAVRAARRSARRARPRGAGDRAGGHGGSGDFGEPGHLGKAGAIGQAGTLGQTGVLGQTGALGEPGEQARDAAAAEPMVPAAAAAPAAPATPVPALAEQPPAASEPATPTGPVPEQRTTSPAGPRPLTELPLPRVQFATTDPTDPTAARAAATAIAAAAPGPLVVATTDPALWAETKDSRAKLGPLLTYDPTHRLDTPARLRWSPTSGCEDVSTAAARAAALLAPVRPSGVLDSAVADAAQTLLRCWLHAAAVDGRPFRQLHRWAHTTGGAQEPVRILRTSAKASAGQAGELESVLTAYAERSELAKELAGRALTALASLHIRDACTPLRTDSLLLESFIDEGGTLYVVGDPIEDPRTDPGAMPLLTALLSSVVEHGRRMAERSSAGRLDPPLTLVLDDIAALAPLPALPDLLETGRTRGLLTLATMRSQEQARARWPHRSLPV
ncbi:TraM recognition domain-containing protein [Streptomyces sp. NPDC001339]|uniref:TraM recognition domain-containing protein n=1 Tax=Streptomyces sp. NPDC001339 TaxID=3364563 RepID=UPI00367DC36B